MKLTLMLMGGSAFLLVGILGIYFGSGAHTMDLFEIAKLHNIPMWMQRIFFPMTFLGFGVLGVDVVHACCVFIFRHALGPLRVVHFAADFATRHTAHKARAVLEQVNSLGFIGVEMTCRVENPQSTHGLFEIAVGIFLQDTGLVGARQSGASEHHVGHKENRGKEIKKKDPL